MPATHPRAQSSSETTPRRAALAAAAALLSITLVPAVMAREAVAYRVASASVVVKCPMTVGGGFEAKTDELSGDLSWSPANPGTIGGELAVALANVDTGINLRNRHMREKYLEVDREGFASARLTDIVVAGLAAGALEGKHTFTATLHLHGASKPVEGQAVVTRSDRGLSVEASFPVNLPDYDIKKPRHLGIGVKDTIHIEVEVQLETAPAAAETTPAGAAS